MDWIKQPRLRATCLRCCVFILTGFLFTSVAFYSPAQEPHYWSIALADTLMKRNTGAPGESLTPWSYWKGYTLSGFAMLWQSTGDRRYLDYIKQQIDPFIDRDGNLVNVKLDSLDNAMAGNIVVGLYEHTHDPRYRAAAIQIYAECSITTRAMQMGAFGIIPGFPARCGWTASSWAKCFCCDMATRSAIASTVLMKR